MTFLYNAWYCGAWGHEVHRQPMVRTLLNEPVMFYRTQAGQVAAMANRCPHRFAPLHKGRLIGDTIECPYHGLQFDIQGRCVHSPHGAPPKAAYIKSYAVAERYGVVWIWMGDSANANPADIPDFAPFADPNRYAVEYGYLKIPAHYELMTDNLLDLSHVEFLHPFLYDRRPPHPGFDVLRNVRQEGNTIYSDTTLLNARPNDLFKMLSAREEDCGEMRANMRWDAPGNLYLDTGFKYFDGGGPSTPNAHLLTPETELSTHYHFALARDSRTDDAEIGRAVLKGTTEAFANEDEPMIGWCQENMRTTDFDSLNPVLLSNDVAPVKARRVLKALIAAEQTATGQAERHRELIPSVR